MTQGINGVLGQLREDVLDGLTMSSCPGGRITAESLAFALGKNLTSIVKKRVLDTRGTAIDNQNVHNEISEPRSVHDKR